VSSRCLWCGGAFRGAEPLVEFDLDGEPNTQCACGEKSPTGRDDEDPDPAFCVVGWDDGAKPVVGVRDPIWDVAMVLGYVLLVIVAGICGRLIW